MFKITDKTIEVTRGDSMAINFSIDNYTFDVGDTVEFRVYEKKGLENDPVIEKKIEVKEQTEVVRIEVPGLETKIGDIQNKPVTYWYEIELNDNSTIIGYDEDGAKELILYPEGAEE